MEIPANHPFVLKLRSPVRLVFLKKSAAVSFKGRVTGKDYRFGGQIKYTWVDERDVPGFLAMKKRNQSLFKVDESQEKEKKVIRIVSNDGVDPLSDFVTGGVKHKEVPRVEEKPEDEPESESDDDIESFDFTVLHGIGLRGLEYLNSEGVYTLQELHEAGLEFTMTIPYVNEQKAIEIMSEVENLLNKEN